MDDRLTGRRPSINPESHLQRDFTGKSIRDAMIMPLSQPEKAEHEKNDDDGADEPDDSVHSGYPLLARLACEAALRMPAGLVQTM